MSMKVSVIVPVYNSEIHLPVCLDSLVNQSFEEMEIVLINNASTDRSPEIIDQYKKEYPDKITVVTLLKNRGPGGARNEGIKVAKGDYLGFVDSDDDVKTTMFEELYKIAYKTDADMVDSHFYYEEINQNIMTTGRNVTGNLDLEKRRELFIHAGFLFSKIIKREIIVSNHLLFRENVAYSDIDFLRVLILYCNKLSASDLMLYHHRNNFDSLTNHRNLNIQAYEKMDAMRALVNRFKKLHAYEEYKNEIVYYIFETYAVMLSNIMRLNKEEINIELFKDLHDFFFELIDCDYHKNRYILNFKEELKVIAEVNNIDYEKMASICMK